jgi:excisionase family DNA binding protein
MQTQVLPQLHALGVVSSRTSLSRSALYREIKAGRLRALKIGKSLRVSETDLQVFIASLQESKAV